MTQDKTVEMFVGGLVLDPGTQAPIVVLKDESGKFALPIWIGIAEATSIATVLKKMQLARPMTHDLLVTALSEVGIKVQSIVITDLKDATYYSELVLTAGDKAMILDARPSDAIAIALRTSAPIFVSQSVLDQAKVAFMAELPPGEESMRGDKDQQAEGEGGSTESIPESEKDFKHIDKERWAEILAGLDPDDFKYKM